MGNTLLKLLGGDCFDSRPDVIVVEVQGGTPAPPPHGVTHGVAALAHDIFNFEITSQVPEGLSRHVVSSKRAQASWYKKLLEAWKETKPAPKTPQAAATLVVRALSRNQRADLEGLLAYYGLPFPSISETVGVPSSSSSSSLPEGVKYQLRTLPVDAKDVCDGDGINAYVSTADPKESADVPIVMQEAAIQTKMARAARNFKEAKALKKSISDAGYGFKIDPNGEEILAKKYRIRLRGIDAPESEMEYGKEAKDELVKLVKGKSLRIDVYNNDQYGRTVGDVYCDRIFVQEQMLKRGFAWHFKTYDKRPEFERWQKEAQAGRRGLWGLENPEKPWVWRKRNAGWREGSVPVEVY